MDITVQNDSEVTCAIAGEADADNCHLIGEALIGREFDSATVHLDLSALTFLDSSAISELLRVRGELADAGVMLTVSEVSPPVRRVLEITGLLDTFGIAQGGQPTEAG